MNIQQFQYVLAVVNSKNFKTAAKSCFVTQSTLSTMIGRFEEEIGIKIFNRKTKPVSVTREGEQIISRLRILVNEVEQLKNVVQEIKGEMVGELRIGVIPTVSPYILPLFLTAFASKFPNVKMIIKEMPTNLIQVALKNRSLDVGILAIPLEDEELREQELYSEPFLLYDCSKNNKVAKISIKELDYSRLWLLQEGHCLRTQVSRICEQSNLSPNNEFKFEFESGSIDSLLRFTKANEGITIIPYLASLDLKEEEKLCLTEFKHPIPVRSIGLVTHKYFAKKRLLQELKNAIQKSIKGIIPQVKYKEVVRPV